MKTSRLQVHQKKIRRTFRLLCLASLKTTFLERDAHPHEAPHFAASSPLSWKSIYQLPVQPAPSSSGSGMILLAVDDSVTRVIDDNCISWGVGAHG